MTALEKILIPLFVIAIICVEPLWSLELIPKKVAQVAIMVSVGSLVGLCGLYITKFKVSIYSGVLILLALYPISNLFIYKGWFGVAFLRLGHDASNYIIGILLFITANAIYKAHKEAAVLNIIVAVLLIGQSFILKVGLREFLLDHGILNYGIIAAILFMKLRPTGYRIEEVKILNVVALLSGMFLLARYSEQLLI